MNFLYLVDYLNEISLTCHWNETLYINVSDVSKKKSFIEIIILFYCINIWLKKPIVMESDSETSRVTPNKDLSELYSFDKCIVPIHRDENVVP